MVEHFGVWLTKPYFTAHHHSIAAHFAETGNVSDEQSRCAAEQAIDAIEEDVITEFDTPAETFRGTGRLDCRPISGGCARPVRSWHDGRHARRIARWNLDSADRLAMQPLDDVVGCECAHPRPYRARSASSRRSRHWPLVPRLKSGGVEPMSTITAGHDHVGHASHRVERRRLDQGEPPILVDRESRCAANFRICPMRSVCRSS